MSTPSGSAPPALAAPAHPVLAGKRTLTLYLLGILLTPIVLLTATFFIVPTEWFNVRAENSYLANMGYGEHLHNADCKILVYGDSSAMVGVDPTILERITGLSACNIAEFEGVTMINGMMVPAQFLERNPRPRYMVFLYAPESLAPQEKWKWVSTFEAISFRFQYKRDWDAFLTFATHPTDFFSWLELGLRTLVTHASHSAMSAEKLNLRVPTRGQLVMDNAVATTCGKEDRYATPDPAWIENIRHTFGKDGTRVLVDVTPEPACDATFPFYRQKLAGLTDNTLEQYPIADYNAEGRLHMKPSGSARLSAEIANQIAALEAGLQKGRP